MDSAFCNSSYNSSKTRSISSCICLFSIFVQFLANECSNTCRNSLNLRMDECAWSQGFASNGLYSSGYSDITTMPHFIIHSIPQQPLKSSSMQRYRCPRRHLRASTSKFDIKHGHVDGTMKRGSSGSNITNCWSVVIFCDAVVKQRLQHFETIRISWLRVEKSKAGFSCIYNCNVRNTSYYEVREKSQFYSVPMRIVLHRYLFTGLFLYPLTERSPLFSMSLNYPGVHIGIFLKDKVWFVS